LGSTERSQTTVDAELGARDGAEPDPEREERWAMRWGRHLESVSKVQCQAESLGPADWVRR
jgi:hypothetical protein